MTNEWPGLTGSGRKRKGNDEQLVAALVEGQPLVRAAASAGISERTARRRAADASVRQEILDRRQSLAAAHAGALLDAVQAAIGTLRELSTASGSEAIRLRASSAVLSHALTWRATVDLEGRVENLEAALQDGVER